MIRVALWETLYYKYNKEPPKIVSVIIIQAPRLEIWDGLLGIYSSRYAGFGLRVLMGWSWEP